MGSIKTVKSGVDIALNVLRGLPRVSLYNLRPYPSIKCRKRGRGDHGGNYHGDGRKTRCYTRLGFQGGSPFYLKFGFEDSYNKGHALRKEYKPVSLESLQLMIDTGRIDASRPIDLAALSNTGVFYISPQLNQYGAQLTDVGIDKFQARVNIEVQWTTERVIAAVERNGGTIRTAYFDTASLLAAMDPVKFFRRGVAIPFRHLPDLATIEYYTDPRFRGYLADPEKVAEDRLVLAQKYGYELPDIKKLPECDMLLQTKDPRQIFYGLEPGWIVNLRDKIILRPLDEELKKFFAQ